MFVIIKDNKSINTYELNHDIKYKDIEIYYKNTYYIKVINDLYFSDNTKIKELKIGSFKIKNNKVFYEIEVFVYENGKGYDDFRLYKNTSFIISDSNVSNIVNNDPNMKNKYLSYNNGYLKSNYDFSVNNLNYNNNHLNEGDLVEFVGFKFIYFNDFLYINCFNVENKLLEYKPFLNKIKYAKTDVSVSYYLPKKINEFIVEELIEYKPIKKINKHDFIKNLISNIIMVISTSMMALIGFYSQVLNNQINIGSYAYLIMPMGILLTSIIIPIIFNIIETKNNNRQISNSINDYLLYLSAYETRLKESLDNYLDCLNNSFFDLNSIEGKLFYANRKSKDYLTLSIGKINRKYPLEYKRTNIEIIDNRLASIKQLLDSVDDYPLYLDLKQYRINTLVCKDEQKKYFFYLVLLELCYKHHYDDICISIFSKDSSIIDNIYNLPHLFINNKRLTFNSIKQLIELDQMNINKPVVLLMYEYADYVFSNNNIKVIYFSNNKTKLLKDNDCVIEYLNNYGYIYSNDKIKFKYYEKLIDFAYYFRYLGKLKNTRNNYNIFTFKDVLNGNSILDNYSYCDNLLKAYFSYNNNELLCLDLHESKQGPHGLIGGSTGSGKSELIVSLLLSLCIRYRPDYLNIVLIDYKGGGIKESLAYNNEIIPHIVASVSNLENNSLNRLIIALKNECISRQEKFKRLSNDINLPIVNIDDYLANTNKALAHLLIVVDEFAELKKQQPDAIKELISLSRIGRSLGLHLILATQKPAGVIDEEIWSNSRFKLALKVFEEKDSMDIIKTKDAAYLNDVGSFMLLVDSGISMGQSIFSKNDINGNDPYKIALLNNCLEMDKEYKKESSKTLPEVNYLTSKIIEATQKLNIKNKKIDFLPSQPLTRKELVKGKCLPLGEIDDYINNKKSLLAYDIHESLLIYSSRKNEINGILNNLSECARTTIVIGSKEYKNTYISDSLLYGDQEDIMFLLNYLLNKKHDDLTLVVEDLSCLLSYNDLYGELLYKLVRRINKNLSLVFISTNTQIGFKIINSFKYKIMIGLIDNNDLSSFYGCKGRYVGKNYFYDEEPICFVPIKLEALEVKEPVVESIVLRIPEIVQSEIKDDKYLLGYDLQSKEKVFSKDVTIISFDETYLHAYKKAYPKVNILKYEHSLCKKQYKNILWLGSGVYNQRLINADISKELKYNECLYMCDNRWHILRGLDYA